MELFDEIGYSNELRAFDKRIPKAQMFMHGELTKSERDLLTERVEQLRLCYVLNVHTYPMDVVVNSEEHYDSILWVLVSLRRDVSTSKLSRIIQETLPSPTVIVYELEGKYLFSSALKRLNKNEKEKVVVTEYHFSGWIDFDNLGSSERLFLSSIALSSTPRIDYKQAYEYIHRGIFEVSHSDIVAKVEASDFNDLKAKTELELSRLQEIERLTKLINQKSLSLRDKIELAKKIKELNN